MRALGYNGPLIQFLILALYVVCACLYHMLLHFFLRLHFFLTYLITYLSFPLRMGPLRFQAGCRKRRLKPGFSFLVFICVGVHLF